MLAGMLRQHCSKQPQGPVLVVVLVLELLNGLARVVLRGTRVLLL